MILVALSAQANWFEVWVNWMPKEGASAWTPPGSDNLFYLADFSEINALDLSAGGVKTYGPKNTATATEAEQSTWDLWWERSGSDGGVSNITTLSSGNVVANHQGNGAAYSDALRLGLPDSQTDATFRPFTNWMVCFWVWRDGNETEDRYFDTTYNPDCLIDDNGSATRFYIGTVRTTADIAVSNWTHIAMGVTNSVMFGYVNGVQVATSAGPATMQRRWAFGAGALANSWYVKGKYDDIAVYDGFNSTWPTNWVAHGSPATRSK